MAFTLIPETGEIVPGANTYATADQIDEFLVNELIDPPLNVYYLASKAAKTLDNRYTWLGDKVSKTQSMQWPRKNLGPCNSHIATPVIPDELVTAQLYHLADMLTTDVEEGVRTDQSLRRKKVGNLEIEFFDSKSGVSDSSTWLVGAKEMLSGLTGAIFKTSRV